MELDPKVPPCHTSDRNSFAQLSAKTRWPVILTGAIDDVSRAVSACPDGARRDEGKKIVEDLARLNPLPDDGEPDIADYNAELAALPFPATWFNVPWMFSECYLYRRVAALFALSTHWKSHDVFGSQKISTFRSSRPAVLELAARYRQLITELASPDPGTKANQTPEQAAEAERLLFIEIAEICLWGNATDLSLLTSLTYSDIQKLQGADARKASEKNILVNDLPAAYAALKHAQSTNPNDDRRIDIVLDNAGFELFVDLVFAGYLIASGLGTHVVLHPKSMPWFVSDVIPADFAALLNALADPKSFYERQSEDEKHRDEKPAPLSEDEAGELGFVFQHWSELYAEGKLVIRPNRFWTHAGSFWRMPREKELWDDLKTSELVVYKGDLNYRKLTGDGMWPPTTPFEDAIGPLAEGSEMRSLVLRTCKSDVVVGLPEGKDEEIKGLDGDRDAKARKWAWSGKWAVVQFVDGKS